MEPKSISELTAPLNTGSINSAEPDEKPVLDLESGVNSSDSNANNCYASCCPQFAYTCANWIKDCWNVTSELSWKENILQIFFSLMAAASAADASIDIPNQFIPMSPIANYCIGTLTGVVTFFATASGVGNSLKNAGQLSKRVNELERRDKKWQTKTSKYESQLSDLVHRVKNSDSFEKFKQDLATMQDDGYEIIDSPGAAPRP